MRRPSYTIAMRDWSIELGDWVWVALDGTPPPHPALAWRELVEIEPGVKVWRNLP